MMKGMYDSLTDFYIFIQNASGQVNFSLKSLLSLKDILIMLI